MHLLLLIGAFLFFAFIAPLKVTLAACALLVVIPLVVKVSARVIANTDASFAEAFKAVALAFVLLAVSLFTLVSFSRGTGVSQFYGLSGWVVLGFLLGSYALGFKLGLSTSFGASLGVALVSTAVSGLMVWAARGAL